MNKPDPLKSIIYFLAGILITLVLIEKSLNGSHSDGFQVSEFKNTNITSSYSIPIVDIEPTSYRETQSEKTTEDELIDELLSESIQKPNYIIPTESLDEDDYKLKSKEIPIYFIKFQKDRNKNRSYLVKTNRKISYTTQLDLVDAILRELLRGPNEKEKENGYLNSIPKNLTYSESNLIENDILNLYLGEELEYGAGTDLILDRIDQITFSLLDNLPIQGIKLYLNNSPVTEVGGDGIVLPPILKKRERVILDR